MNPDELVWNCLKGDLGRKTIIGPDQMRATATECLDAMKSNPDMIMALFREENVRDAA